LILNSLSNVDNYFCPPSLKVLAVMVATAHNKLERFCPLQAANPNISGKDSVRIHNTSFSS
jgi:hypothetical protein